MAGYIIQKSNPSICFSFELSMCDEPTDLCSAGQILLGTGYSSYSTAWWGYSLFTSVAACAICLMQCKNQLAVCNISYEVTILFWFFGNHMTARKTAFYHSYFRKRNYAAFEKWFEATFQNMLDSTVSPQKSRALPGNKVCLNKV